MAIKIVHSFILAIKKSALFLMSTKADTPISVLSLSLSCNPSSCLSPPLPPPNHLLRSLRVVTAHLSLHSRGMGVRANTHAQASV